MVKAASFESGYLKVSSTHQIYFEEVGNPLGTPVLYLHGGPGAGLPNNYHSYFDLKRCRVIGMDQRGSGRSEPLGCLEENTIQHLVEDINVLREYLGLTDWVLFGGSWGCTLALAYALKYPENVRGLFLRGVFLGTNKEIQWFYHKGANLFYPEEWKYFDIRSEEAINSSSNLISQYYYDLCLSDKPIYEKKEIARRWIFWEVRLAMFEGSECAKEEWIITDELLAFAQLEVHYFYHSCFFPYQNYILERLSLSDLKEVPTTIVQGRYDLVCPPRYAFDLHQKMTASKLVWIEKGGHASYEKHTKFKMIEEFKLLLDKVQYQDEYK
ncbi:prolyl aminopeptidase [Sediminitomix flava]|uniref:Proline iminopeptidase n=1 Tax=Sediminitomix flava TaxID=379075 RepID=A0A315ZAI3_SEDFL|nr:prolyl aminopeptidase [Sediminitomix flava]PWJ42551.1 prolyl aminopeptidase [Sediminitomix flava]